MMGKGTEIDDFFTQVRKAERRTVVKDDKNTRYLLGEDASPKDEPLRFRFNHSTGFSSGLNEAFKQLSENGELSPEQQPEVLVNFLGLLGPSGALPQHYTRLMIERIKNNDVAMADFINIFNHRLISLFYRAWSKYKFPLQYEKHLDKPEQDPFTRSLKSLSGQHSNQDYNAPIFYSGHFSKINRSGANLQSIVQHFLNVKVKITSFVGQWLLIEKPQQLVIGSRLLGKNNKLGEGVLPGKRFWDVQSKISIKIGPITHRFFENLLPGTKNFSDLKKLLDTYTPSHIHIDLLFLVEDAIKNSKPLGKGIKLAQNSWLHGSEQESLYAKISLSRH